MNLRKFNIVILQLIIVFFALTGCAKYATKGKMIEKIEHMTPVGMKEGVFTKEVHNAKLVQQEGNKKIYVVVASDPCFFCGSGKTFLRSFEIYADKFTFEDGKLISVDRIVNGK